MSEPVSAVVGTRRSPQSLTTAPRTAVLAGRFAVAATAALAAQLWLQATFRLVEHPVSLGAANLEADPGIVRGWYRTLMEHGTYGQMIRTEVVDLIWPVTLAATLFCLYRLVGGLLRRHRPRAASLIYRLAPLGIVGPAFDLVENAFSLAMLTDPFGFPDWWAAAHVWASWAKIAGSVAAGVVGPTLTVVALVRGRTEQRTADDGALSPR
ncbi:hypothetical protein [Georgenia deserti]|uniref:DUF2975 domain-containing protein n=1 Tax=Georgenia deserti TaxID=2093781 RepID=A0ABW4L8C7_9MICO